MSVRSLASGHRPHKWAFALVVVFAATQLAAQNEEDALRIGTMRPQGTARSLGLGGAFGALGGDAGALWVNPGAMALYTTTEFSITPGIEFHDASNTFYGTASSNSDARIFFGNLALVLNFKPKEGSAMKGSSFGLVFDRTASHHWERVATGAVNSSLLQQFADAAHGQLPEEFNQFTTDLAWQTYGINQIDSSLNYVSAIPAGAATEQRHTISTGGANTNTSFFYAGNYNNRLYFGAAIGILGSKLERRIVQNETTSDEDLDLKSLRYEERLVTRGTGFDVKLGVVGRITDQFRLGASLHSPAFFSLTDAYFSRMETSFRTPDSSGVYDYAWDSPDGSYSYRLNTPWRVLASAAYIVGKRGVISADYEYSSPRNMRFRTADALVDDYDFGYENSRIKDLYRPTHSVRAGTEWRLGVLYLRGGVAWWMDPYVGTSELHGSDLMRYSLGGGFRKDRLSLDLTVAYDQRSGSYYTYGPDYVDPVRETTTAYRALFTVAYRP